MDFVDELRDRATGTERTLSGALYSHPDHFQDEAERLLSREWLCLGRADEIPSIGDYFTVQALNEPLLVTRANDGDVHVLANICRHRGSPVASGSGNAKKFVCPYHAWSYGLDGALRATPRMPKKRAQDLCGLPRHRSEIWAGFVYVNLDGEAAPMAPRLTGLSDILQNYRTEEMRCVHSAEEVWATNWKCLVENFMEAYHLSVVHPETLHWVTPTGLSKKFDGGDGYTGYVANYPADVPARGKGAPELTAEQRHRSTLFSVFPCHVASQSASLLVSLCLLPEGPEAVRVRWTASVYSDDFSDEEIAERITLWSDVNAEDRAKLEATQKGFRSRFAADGPLAPGDMEGTIADFHRYLGAKLAP
ncbi:MAG: aromatic ring-hydroxylating dioxygenase subunit alpha [Pseudomonadota bacterium]